MPRRNLFSIVALAVFAAGAGALAQGGGRTGPATIATAWDGVFTDEQAGRGRLAFSQHCAACHGAALQGGEAKALSGDRFWSDWTDTSVDYLLGQISRNMPGSEDGSLAGTLTPGTYADIVAHILKTNGFPAGARELTASSIARVAIVPKDGPGELPADAAVHLVGCLSRDAAGTWRIVRAARPARVLTGRAPDVTRALGDREYALMFVVTRLDKYAGHRMSVIGRLIGAGGSGGVNVDTIAPVAERCE